MKVLILTSLLCFFVVGSAVAQEDIFVGEVNPTVVPTGVEQTVTVKGENFVEPQSISLIHIAGETTTELAFSLISASEIQVIIPAELEVGEYDLCLHFSAYRDCTSFIVTSPATIESIDFGFDRDQGVKDKAYNLIDNTFEVSASNIVGTVTVLLNDIPLELSNTLPSEDRSFTANFTLPKGFTPGTYNLTLTTDLGISVTLEEAIDVVGDPINASISGIAPERIERYSNDTLKISVSGENLKDIIDIEYPDGNVLCGYWSRCQSLSSSESAVSFELENRDYDTSRAGSLANGQITFLDGTTLDIPALIVVDAIAPWNTASSVAFGLFFLLLASSWAFSYFTITIRDQELFVRNQDSPGIGRSIAMLVSVVLIAILLCLIYFGIWWVTSGFPAISFSFLGILLLSGSNIVLAPSYALESGKYTYIAPFIMRWLLAIVIMILAIIIPFVFSASLSPVEIPLAIEVALLVIASTLAGTSLYVSKQRLDEQRRNTLPSDEFLMSEVERLLYSNGIVTKRDEPFLKLPFNKAQEIFRRFNSQNRVNLALSLSDFSEEALSIRFVRDTDVKTLAINFKKTREVPSKENIALLAKAIWTQLGFEEGEAYKLSVKQDSVFSVFSIHPKGLESVLPEPFPFIIFSSRESIKSYLSELKKVLNELNVPGRFGVLVAVHQAESTTHLVNAEFGGISRENLVVIGERDCSNIAGNVVAVDQAFMDITKDQIDFNILSPYQTEAPTPIDMFYGRTSEINAVLERVDNGSVVVLGARRIGKTSMLQSVKQTLTERGRILLYLDCYAIGRDKGNTNAYNHLFKEMQTRWHSEENDIFAPNSIEQFPEWLIGMQTLHPDRQIIIQLDEVDALMKYDITGNHDEKLFRMFRSLAQEKRCQFIFSGERTILDRLGDPSSSFFNFATPIRLGLLDIESVSEMVQHPMQLIGTKLDHPQAICEMVYEQTSGHPNLVQTVCRDCLRQLNASGTRTLTIELVQNAVASDGYRERYLETFWSQSTAMEKAIALIIAKNESIALQDILEQLRGRGVQVQPSEAKRGIDYLKLAQLVFEDTKQFAIKPQQFVSLLEETFDLDLWLDEYIEEWAKGKTQ